MVVEVVRLIDKNKAYFAFVAPVIVALLVSAANWIVTGAFDATEIRMAASGAILGLASAISTYFAKPGEAVVASVDTEVADDDFDVVAE